MSREMYTAQKWCNNCNGRHPHDYKEDLHWNQTVCTNCGYKEEWGS